MSIGLAASVLGVSHVIETGSGGGPVVSGPAGGSTNNAVPTWNGVGGNQLNNSDLIYTSGILQRTGTNAFQLQDAASVTRFQWNATATVVNDQSGTNVIQLNSGSALFGTGTNSSNGRIQLAAATTSAGGIGFGTDTVLYRASSGQLKTDGSFTAAGNINVTGSTTTNTLITAAGPTSATPPWNLGAIRTGVTLAVSTTQGIQVGINGVLFTLAVLTTNP